MLLTSIAYAEETVPVPPPAESGFASLLPIILMVVIFYFLIIRPQHKKMKEHDALVNAVKKGDEVITSGGIIGIIKKAEEGSNVVFAEIAEGVEVKISRSSISSVITETSKTSEKQTSNPKSKGKKRA